MKSEINSIKENNLNNKNIFLKQINDLKEKKKN